VTWLALLGVTSAWLFCFGVQPEPHGRRRRCVGQGGGVPGLRRVPVEVLDPSGAMAGRRPTPAAR
jgi:hypothetical protein